MILDFQNSKDSPKDSTCINKKTVLMLDRFFNYGVTKIDLINTNYCFIDGIYDVGLGF